MGGAARCGSGGGYISAREARGVRAMIESALEEARRYDDPQWSGILALGAIATVGGVLIWELMLVSLGLVAGD